MRVRVAAWPEEPEARSGHCGYRNGITSHSVSPPPRTELLPAHEIQVHHLGKPREQGGPATDDPRMYHDPVLIDQPQLGQGHRNLHTTHANAPQVPARELDDGGWEGRWWMTGRPWVHRFVEPVPAFRAVVMVMHGDTHCQREGMFGVVATEIRSANTPIALLSRQCQGSSLCTHEWRT